LSGKALYDDSGRYDYVSDDDLFNFNSLYSIFIDSLISTSVSLVSSPLYPNVSVSLSSNFFYFFSSFSAYTLSFYSLALEGSILKSFGLVFSNM
jgi:hypothetical protein